MKNEKDSIEKAFFTKGKKRQKSVLERSFLKGIKQGSFFRRKNLALSSLSHRVIRSPDLA